MNIRLDPILNRAQNGLDLAQRVLLALAAGSDVTVDFTDVQRITPSFSNAFIMTLLNAHPLDDIRKRVQMINRNNLSAKIINDSAVSYQDGLRLNTQQAYA